MKKISLQITTNCIHYICNIFLVKGLDVDSLFISHIQVNQAHKQSRRTYHAHGQINPYMSSSCHIELILSEKEESVKKEVIHTCRM
ncbi:unnamed protein product [Coffea canephora]|uniref:DH200=94 genomic scaffold, scaffold_216 n=1 Tax=Coffea canephora TaxID=49390 RepID=A0A068VC61_COFCA|nr:unnamed protein product [Coffea canephora]